MARGRSGVNVEYVGHSLAWGGCGVNVEYVGHSLAWRGSGVNGEYVGHSLARRGSGVNVDYPGDNLAEGSQLRLERKPYKYEICRSQLGLGFPAWLGEGAVEM